MWSGIDLWLAGAGFALGAAFGSIAQRSRFCVVSAVSNLTLMRDYRQLHAYLAALGVAVLGTFTLEWTQLVAVGETSYRRPTINWLGALGGGLIFGVGAMLAGGCASRTLIRTAEGNLGALVTLMAFAMTAMATFFGVLAPVRTWLATGAIEVTAGDASVAAVLGWPVWVPPLIIALVCVGAILGLGRWRDHWGTIVAGALIGLLVVIGWWITGAVAMDPFDPRPPISLAVAGPLARGLAWLSMDLSSGSVFALALIPGGLAGAFAAAMFCGELRWVAPAGARVGAYLAGGALMGFGALVAGGCNIGQGLTGASTLSLTSLLAVAGTAGGMLLGLAWLDR